MDLISIKNKVDELMTGDDTGHGLEHVERVCNLAMDIADKEGGNKDVVALAALLHDCDDYKLFGQECAENLTNAKKIMADVDDETKKAVLDIVANMGYSKSLQGIRPKSLEGKIVSDADMLDAMGAMAIIRTLMFHVSKSGHPIFDANVFPAVDLSYEEYRRFDLKTSNVINHFFEKLLKLQGMLFTKSAKDIGKERHQFMVDFLYRFFEENRADEWAKYLDSYLERVPIR